MPRFFVEPSDISQQEIRIKGPDAFHIARSLRMAVGDTIWVCSPDGLEYRCALRCIRDDLCLCEILDSSAGNTEMPFPVTLFMALPKGDKFELVIQKAVELGVTKIVPFISSRCIRKTSADKADRQWERYNRIAMEAAKQCGRCRVPQVTLPIDYKTMLAQAGALRLPLFCYEGDGTVSIRSVLDGVSDVSDVCSVGVIVGSEGGFSPEEAGQARDAGLILTGLGKRILRCETAPLYALAALSFRFEL